MDFIVVFDVIIVVVVDILVVVVDILVVVVCDVYYCSYRFR